MIENNYVFIIVVAPNDCRTLEYALPFCFQYLPIKEIKIIGNVEVYNTLSKNELWRNNRIEFVNEDVFLKIKDVQDAIKKIIDNEESIKRAGWYLQQFIKMLYAFVCKDEYYVVWDADTIPLRRIDLFIDDKPVFNMKEEYNTAYFETMSRLIVGLKKFEEKSFIAEHMIVNTKIMLELIDEISGRNIIGDTFWEKILYSINPYDIRFSGFSEFETYGNYCMLRHPDLYVKRTYDSFRFAAKYFLLDEMNKRDFEWIARDYPAASFEKLMQPYKFYKVFSYRFIQEHFHIKKIFEFQDTINRLYKRVRNKILRWIKKK